MAYLERAGMLVNPLQTSASLLLPKSQNKDSRTVFVYTWVGQKVGPATESLKKN